mgnify:CR=1 FL=1
MIHHGDQRRGQHLLLGFRGLAAEETARLWIAFEEDLVEAVHERGLALDHQGEALSKQGNVQ